MYMSKKRVLLVEDNREVREMLKSFLEETMDVEIRIAKDGVEALNLLRRDNPEFDAVILDVMMRSHGGTVADFLRRHPQYKDIPIIYHTGLSREQLDKKILEGAYYVEKSSQSMWKIKELLSRLLG